MPEVSPVQPETTPKKKKNWQLYLLIIIFIFWFITLAILIFLLLENARLKKEIVTPPSEEESTSESLPTPTSRPENALVSQDNTWDLYTNYLLGFSMLIPKIIYHYNGACDWKEAEKSYRPKMGQVPVKIFEEGDHAYISTEYFYELTGERIENDTHYYSGCEKVANSLAKLEDKDYFQQQKWKIVSAKIETDQELLKLIQENFGPGCKIGERKPTAQTDVFDMVIDNTSPTGEVGIDNQSCPINYIYYLKYSPSRARVITWVFGQAANFFKDAQHAPYDEEMAASFKMTD
jgi:hypothetical protein